ncbi:class III lanthionine synthetase LanKC [Cellulomonas triticagri]|uniref:Protein kinase domain-containing protein n=1 Tax=Cellulomonas triticagri TaxID=2483352 RepID=A0A3M2JL63_9CELL|nr:class III lanthionine synthetase LanKC [Cellulomonas triticagri]RMI12956.1 hypothetical protein EBM89_06345 [Cellulomonas triticagri]
MVNTAYLDYCLGDPYFYDTPRSLDDDAFEAPPAPAGWRRTVSDGWCHVEPPGVELPAQGWKIHLSTTLEGATALLDVAARRCFDLGLAFKFLATRHELHARNAKYADRGGSGKFVTVYPGDDAALRTAVEALAAATAGFAGPYILSDLRWGTTPVHVRYGGFTPMTTEGDHGRTVPAVLRPDGSAVPDRRDPEFVVPEWVTLPDFLVPQHRSYLAQDTPLPFEVAQAVHYSNAGGVYLGSVPGVEEQVIIKEGRRHAGLDGVGASGFERVGHEADVLALLDGITGVPEVVRVDEVWEHRFLTMTRVDGHSLTMDVAVNNPISTALPSRDEVDRYDQRVRTVVADIRRVLAAVHERGVSVGDLQPENVLVTEHAAVSLIDFEAARTAQTPRALGTPGFLSVAPRDRFAEDLFALHRLTLFLYVPLTEVLTLAPALAERHVALAEQVFGDRAAELVRSSRAASGEPAHDGHDGFEVLPPGHLGTAAGRADLARGIVSTSCRFSDRQFPGDIAQFEGDGGVDLWSGSAGTVLALHRAGHLSPAVDAAFLAGLPRDGLTTDALFTGSLGVATVLDELGHHEQAARWWLRLLSHGPRVPADIGLRAGLGGLLLGLLAADHPVPQLQERSGDLADELVVRVRTAAAAPVVDPRPRAGLFDGWSGAAVALLLAADRLGRTELVEVAREAVHLDLVHCITVRDESLQVDDAGRALPYLAHGGVGIALAAQAVLRRHDDPVLERAVPRLALPACGPLYFCAGLAQGRAGMVAALRLLDERFLPRPRAELLREHVERFDLHCPLRDEGVLVPGDQNLRFSADYATGAAGLLLALAPHDRRVAWLPGSVPTHLFA